MTNFEDLDLKQELLRALRSMEFFEPTEVQSKTIPLALDGKNVIVRSKTGSGKTGAFLIPIIQRLTRDDVQSALVIAPTRELAMQVHKVAVSMVRGTGLSATVVYGGASIENQIRNIKQGTNIVIGTPGRIMDLMERRELVFKNLKYLVLDEADIMLDMGFIEDIEFIISRLPREKQMMLFSATIPEPIERLARKYMKNASKVSIGKEEEPTVETIFHSYAVSGEYSKIATLLAYITEYNPTKAIIFSHTKRGADILYDVLMQHGFDSQVIHGDLTQAQRERSLSGFRETARFLIATNVAARGLDITDVSDVINFDVPEDPYVYIHRVGRSARMGATGNAMTIIHDSENSLIRDIENTANIRMSKVELNREPFRDVQFNYTHRKYQQEHRQTQNRGGSGGRSRRPSRGRNNYSYARR